MVTKMNKPPAAKKPATDPDPRDKDMVVALAVAKMVLLPSVNAAAVVETYSKQALGGQDLAALTAALSAGMKGVQAGDMKPAEAMLYGQAHALQAIFMNLARRAASQEYLKQWEAYLRMAMKAQNQCRMTLETLATIKNPPVVFARQANINNGGQQQVNNGTVPTNAGHSARARALSGAGAHAAIAKTEQTELLEASNGQRLDTRAAGAAGGTDPHMETVGAVHRPAHR